MKKTRVAVISDGPNGEDEVASVIAALDPSLYEVTPLAIDADGAWHYRRYGRDRPIDLATAVAVLTSCDVALPIMHGPRGEDGTLPALLDLIGIPCIGAGVRLAAARDHGIVSSLGRAA